MIVYWVALAEIIFYLCAVPVHFAVLFRAGGDFGVSAGFSVFEKRFAEKRAAQRFKKPKTQNSRSKPRGAQRLVRAIIRLRVGRLHIAGRFSMGDAAATALVSGVIKSLECALVPHFPDIILSVLPDFNASISYVDIHGMVSLRSGQIIRAALSGAMKNFTGRLRQWTSIP